MQGFSSSACVHGSTQSQFCGIARSLRNCTLSSPSQLRSRQPLSVEARRQCMLTGKKANNGYNVTFSHTRNKTLQGANLQEKKVYWPERQRLVTLKISTKAIKTIEKRGLAVMAKEIGLDLASLPYRDVRPGRTEWLAAHQPAQPAQSKKGKMKNPTKLAASKKAPKVPYYLEGSARVVLKRD